MSNLAIVPARGGSKRIPNKNIIDFFGKPMIIWTLEAAKNSQLFSRIVVSTESENIKSIVEEYGFDVVLRPKELATDDATLTPVVLNVLTQLAKENIFYKNVCMLMANCPIRDCNDIINSFREFEKKSSKLLMSVFEYGMFYPFWALKNTNKGLTPFFGKKYFLTKSQDLPQVYCPSGAIRWVDVLTFKRDKDFYGDNLQPYTLPWFKAIDIDDQNDLDLAKQVYYFLRNKNKI